MIWDRDHERLYGERLGETAFERAEIRATSRRRDLDCGCVIDSREPYRYYVAKLVGVAQLLQVTQCDFHMRAGDRY